MDATTIDKTTVLDRFDRQRAWWEGLLAEVGGERMTQPGVGGPWTFKDHVAHLSGWQRRTLGRLDASRRGLAPPPSEWPAAFEQIEDEDEAVEAVNAWLYDRNRDRPLADVLAESRGQWDRLRELVAAFSEDELADRSRFPWLEGDSLGGSVLDGFLFEHFREEHEPVFRRWLDGFGERNAAR
jgi:hypothetical protein